MILSLYVFFVLVLISFILLTFYGTISSKIQDKDARKLCFIVFLGGLSLGSFLGLGYLHLVEVYRNL